MPIQICPTHGLFENVICCEGECLRRYCSQCFVVHNVEHTAGVILNDTSKKCLIDWNTFLIEKFKQIQNNVKLKGSNTIFEMKLRNYPPGLLNQLSNAEVVQVTLRIFDQYLQTLSTNIQYISTRQTLDELDIPELFKDLFIFFIYDAGSGLSFLLQKVKSQLQQKLPQKKIYDYIEFVFVPKQMRTLEMKRKTLVNAVQETTLLFVKNINGVVMSPKLAKSRGSDKQKDSPRKNNLFSRATRMKSYNEKDQVLSSSHLQVSQASVSPHLPLNSPVQKQKPYQICTPTKKIQQQQKPFQLGQTIENQNEQFKENNKIKVQQNQKIVLTNPIETVEVGEQQIKIDQKKIEEQQTNRIVRLELKLKQKQKSIKELNNLINNQEQQIHYRENQVQILTQEIKKLIKYKEQAQNSQKELEKVKQHLKLKERSITQLNKLIGNEQEELQFRESEVQTLTNEIKKLVQWKSRCEETQRKLNEKQKELDLREKGIKQLNNVIDNQAEQLAFRENQVEMLTCELKKASQSKIQAQRKLEQIIKQSEQLKKINSELQINLEKAKSSTEIVQKLNQNQTPSGSFDEELMQQVIDLEAKVVSRNQDIKRLVDIVNSLEQYIPNEKKSEVVDVLKKLKTVKVQL